MRGRKPKPAALRKRGRKRNLPTPPGVLPRCPAHLAPAARAEWRRLARPLHDMGVLSAVDRAAFAAYCQAWARWVEAEEKLRETPPLIRTPSGYVQQSPWISIANKQLELMGRYMSELGLTPAARMRVATLSPSAPPPDRVEFVVVYEDKDGNRVESPLDAPTLPGARARDDEPRREPRITRCELDARL